MSKRKPDKKIVALIREVQREQARPLAPIRRAEGRAFNEEYDRWVEAGGRLAEKAISALENGDERAARSLVERLTRLPAVDDDSPTGPFSVSLLLYRTVGWPFEDLEDDQYEDHLDNEYYSNADDKGHVDWLQAPLAILESLPEPAAMELRRALACMVENPMSGEDYLRITAVVDPDRRLDPEFEGVADTDLVETVLVLVDVVRRLRRDIPDHW